MKLPIGCMKCHANTVMLVAVTDNGVYDIECPHGHKSKIIVQNEKYEILFEIGVNAIVDCYPREAISSFSSSLECFYQQSVYAIFLKNGIPHSVIDDCWKEVSNQSERQLGMFISAFLYVVKQKPKILPTTMVTLRNKVIHKGYIPNESEVLSYGEEVRGIINTIKLKINEIYPDIWKHMINRKIEKFADRFMSNCGDPLSTMSVPTIICSVSEGGEGNRPLEEIVSKRKEKKP